MMTCRLLCALLVLALCCCPYVCVAGSEDTTVKAGENPTPQDSGGSNDSDNTQAKGTEINGRSSDKESDSSEGPSKTASAPAAPSPTGTGEEGPRGAPTLQGGSDASAQQGASEENIISPGSKGDSDNSDVNNRKHNKEVALTGKEVKEQAPTTTTTTTTTTTMAPTTTTSAPEAPSDTAMNTEAPTTTTTRAPSRLREIDGSLSSSAWVCAPLLLAVSALACTAVG
ncbi:putative mucin TcMUCII [Trypanosoma cruzi]|uniref:Mucin TcMUCII, putative n=2 Tax=Trypanosoma cruzi TaxID=5693 RepID=Q4DA16_TRYCC|nr:mucin TcMUCII, putative [Trypanosoma cruzi]EAN89369.1 mucin TcMUCII, putative [Trypanosoma cruzi]PWV10665.1 putative mucin TcMUCII [Trypanosoma cruzi]RNC55190.1 mucin TcMUCII [Trypanosoma cruzi]|eukprot:XP_811220.1 mucin TcMUCII [Trypanosoma cruzi strain CL Brener]